MMSEKIKVMVTTEHRGVFAGLADAAEPDEAGRIRLHDCRMCVYWSTEMHGVLGLADQGPNESCRISPAAPSVLLTGVTLVASMSDEAYARWEAEPWD